MDGLSTSTATDTDQSQTLSSPSVATPGDLKEQVHAALFHDLPEKVGRIDFFTDCRIMFYQKYRVVIITAEGLGMDMDHRQNDVNFFQGESQDLAYPEQAEWIDQRKAEQYDSYGKVSLFRAIWTDLVEELAKLKRGTDLYYP